MACIPAGVEKDIHERLNGLEVFQERTFMRVCMGRHIFQEGLRRKLMRVCMGSHAFRKFMRVCMGWHVFQEGLRRKFMRVCMGWHAFGKEIHEGLHGLACVPRGIEKEIHGGLRGLACILGGVEKDIHEGLHGLDVFQERLRRTFMRVCVAGMCSKRD